MAKQDQPNTPQPSDEIDLGQLFLLIGKGFNKLFIKFLRLFIYLKKNAFILLGLIVLGLAIGLGLNRVVIKKHKTEVIVKPNFESKNYLYDVVDEIQSNIKAKDTFFFKNLNIEAEDLNGFAVEINPVSGNNNTDIEYLELLQNFENNALVSDVIRAEILNKSSLNYRITFSYKGVKKGHDSAWKLMGYINSNKYYNELNEVYKKNTLNRIEKNSQSIVQIDKLITNYSKNLAKDNTGINEGKIILENEEKLNLTGLFDIKNGLIREIESRKLQALKQGKIISVINFGKPQEAQKSFFGNSTVFLPTLFLFLFFSFSTIKFLNKKASEHGI